MENLYVGVDLGGTKIYTALVTESGEILNDSIVKTEASKGQEHIVKKIKDSIKHVLNDVDKENVKAIGIGSPAFC